MYQSTMGEDIQNIFLEDGSIVLWDAPPKKGNRTMPYRYNGSTELIEQIGIDSIDEELGPFRIIGSAAKYLADIIHLNQEEPYIIGKKVTGDIKREILFDGGIDIYRKGQIPGTELQGYDLEGHGRIWTATEPEEIFLNSDGLKNMIFDNSSDDIERIEAILKGYETKEKNRYNNQMLSITRSYNEGREHRG